MANIEDIRCLLNAAEEGNITEVQRVLDQDVPVDVVDDDEVTALQVAAANGHEHIVRLLLMRGAALDRANSYGWSPLLHAARHGHVGVVTLLLQHKADINARTKLGTNAIKLAARGGHIQMIKLLVESGIDLSPASGISCSNCEFTPLMSAAHYGHDNVVRHLLDREFDINLRTLSLGVNSLMLAALNGHMATCQILIERGADANLTNVNSHTALQIATISKKREVKGYLERKTTNKPRKSEDAKPDIIEAAKSGDIDRVVEVLREDISQRDACSPTDGATPLMFSAMTGRLDIAQVLVENGCDLNKQDTISGWTALMQATYHGKKQVAKFLVNAGANVLIPAKNGCTAFDLASLIDDVDTELYRLLAANAAQVNKPALGERNSGTGSIGSTGGGKRKWTGKQNGVSVSSENGEEQPKTGLKAWWNRMSNRFRNLKLGRTMSLSSNKLAPMIHPPSEQEETPLRSSVSNANLTLDHESSPNPLKKTISVDALGTTNSSDVSALVSYETIMTETRKSASMYTLGLPLPGNSSISNERLTVLPPFLPPPTFEAERPKMPPVSSRRSIASLQSNSTHGSNRTVVPPMKLLQSFSTSSQNLSPTSPPTPKFQENSESPSSSTGASAISAKSRVASSASSSTLTAGSDNLNRSGGSVSQEPLFMPSKNSPGIKAPSYIGTQSNNMFNRPAVYQRPYGLPGAVTMRGHTKSTTSSSRDSTSTLTASPAPIPRSNSTGSTGSVTPATKSKPIVNSSSTLTEEDELGGLLKNLSLEGYQPIFEEQEVDMEAFLTLTDSDLKDLGISHLEPRRQILAAITELNSGKGREKQHLHHTMTQFDSTFRSKSNYAPSSNGDDFETWCLEENQPMSTSQKSRSS